MKVKNILIVTTLIVIYFLFKIGNNSESKKSSFKGVQWRTNSTLGSEEIWNTKWLRIEKHKVKTEDGKIMDDWIWIDEQEQVNILVHLKAGGYAVYKQKKYGMATETLAPVGGLVEPGELPIEAAHRELLEEMGMKCSEMKPLGRFRVHANRGYGFVSTFVALNSELADEKLDSDDLESQELVKLTRDELITALFDGEFQEVKWTATIALAMLTEKFENFSCK